MALSLLLKRSLVAAFLILAIVLQGTTSVLAGTTGAISGTVIDSTTNKPVAGAKVSVQSPSQSATATSDATGHYAFLSLAPDTYTISVAASGTLDAANINGVNVIADQTQQITVNQPEKIKVIGTVTSRANSSLVRAGTTADVYSISATTQDKASNLGGGGTLNSAWSAISSVPGVYVAPGLNGYIGAGASLSIRGGDYDQIGYELDGIPVNRAFDSYPSNSLSSLGQQELQVYTGAAPANAEAQGISGYLNQVIRTGSAPAYRSLDLSVGAPAFYNKLAFETGGANPSRTFSYYVGLGGYAQSYRYGDQYNGASLSRYNGSPLAPCAGGPETATYNRTTVPSCYSPSGADYTNGNTTPAYALGAYNIALESQARQNDSIVNLHFGLPRKDGNRDDVQLLYDYTLLKNYAFDSTNDQGGAAYLSLINGGAPPAYTDPTSVKVPYGTLLPIGYAGGGAAGTYFYPNSPGGRVAGSTIPYAQEDQTPNNQGIVKLQYQHNFGTSAFLRVYGYTYYSDWLQICPQATDQNYLGFCSPDYELSAHTRGVSALFSSQLNPQHLLSIQAAYTTSSVLRDNNSFYAFGGGSSAAYLVNGNNPYNGICYAADGTPAPGCNFGAMPYSHLSVDQLAGNAPVDPYAATCGTGPCQYAVVSGGARATYNQVRPKFYSASITDNWRPTDKLNINLGLRYDYYGYFGSNTFNSPARTLFYNAYNLANGTNLANIPSQDVGFPEFQPRIGGTYTVNPSTVLRASYGRYAQAPNSAFEQYNYLQPNDIGTLTTFGKLGLGYTNGHNVRPEVSNNYDFSFEHQFGGDTAIKVTPFLRKTQDQIQQFYLDQKTSFVSGLNVGRQTSQGVEFELDKGDFSRPGLAGRISFTYTNSYIQYTKTANGSNVVDGINQNIQGYNAYTSFCGSHPTDKRCGATSSGAAAAPCYDTSGNPDPACATTSVANPYWNAPVAALLDPNGRYATFDTFPAGIGSSYAAYGAPYVFTGIVQWKHDRFTLTPALQFSAGARYGAPANLPGVQPDTCTNGGPPLTSSLTGDPRYPYGAPGGSPYDVAQCGVGSTSFAIPNPKSGNFDGLGQYVQPSIIQLHLQAAYDVNKRITLVGNFANIYSRCFGGSKGYWTTNGACGYGLNLGQSGGINPVGNGYNPGNTLQPFLTVPYGSYFNTNPFNAYFEARIKI